ncbi:MAG: nickel-type superoxide dismutase maturation protease [Acidimicrobiales bacterium]
MPGSFLVPVVVRVFVVGSTSPGDGAVVGYNGSMSSRRPYPPRLGLIAAAAVAVALARMTERVEVAGDSMRPLLQPGDRLVVVRGLATRPGDVVAAVDPRAPGRVLLKRVSALREGHRVELVGDRPETSTDSRHFGPVPLSSVRGRAVWRYWPRHRAGPLGRPASDYGLGPGC